MSAKFIRRIVDVFIGIFIIGVAIRVSGIVSSLTSDESGSLRWPVQSAAAYTEVPFGDGASIASASAELVVPNQFTGVLLDSAASLGMLVLFLVALMALRKVLIRFSDGEMFTEDNAIGIRRIGHALLGVCAVSLIHVVVMQSIILGAIDAPAGAILHPSISWNVAGMENLWLDYDVPLFTFVLGCIAMLFAEAFRNGLAYREDSESVV